MAEIQNYDSATDHAEVLVKNKLKVGDRIELILPEGNRDLTIDRKEDLKGNTMSEALGGGYQVRIPLPPIDYQNGLLARYF